ncbi:MAG: preprotein translocase subunit SecA [Planctomycetota bacterium]|jgi:preprotein translocase subunit SecA
MTAAVVGKTWRMLAQGISNKPLPRGADALWDAGVGRLDRFVPRTKRLLAQARRICDLEKKFSEMTDSRLRQHALDLRTCFRCRRDTPIELDQAFALVREVAFRKIGEKPFPVQVAGGLGLHAGCVTEMATGEGKTLTATLPVTVAGWRGHGCHVITVNDYLAQRDAEWMEPVYKFCGLSVAYIQQQTPPDQRKQAYQADITYCTNKEVAADFLRDRLILGGMCGLTEALAANMTSSRPLTDRLLQRGLHYAVVDEADSILVDEAVTPLIISGEAPNAEQVESFSQAAGIAGKLNPPEDYQIDYQYREITLTPRGHDRVKQLTDQLGGLWSGHRRSMELIQQALTAKEFYTRDKHYLIEDDKVVIIDECTGRMMPDRSWRDGLHQAVEAKENVTVNPPKATFARISFQRFYRLYHKLCGMTGTASEAANEFWQIYHLPVVTIPTHRPCQRKKRDDIVLPTQQAKWNTIVEQIKRIHSTGQPILIGTRSVHASEHLSGLLKGADLSHQVLNAVYHRQESQIVAEAGQHGKITVATNMAGRGTDIKLGRGVAELGGLHVISAEPNESARIDRQLYGRSARQGDPGSAQGIFSLEDEVLLRHAGKLSGYVGKRYADQHRITSAPVRHLLRYAQRAAERLAVRQRRNVLKTDHWLDEQLGFAGSE